MGVDAPNDDDLDLRRQQWADYSQAIRNSQERREGQVRATLVSAATFLTLMSASATGRTSEARASQLLAAQFLLCVLFAGAFAYYLNSLYHHALGIADNAVRRLELEEPGGIPTIEGRGYAQGRPRWRRRTRLPAALVAFIPRYGQSQREAILFAPIVALLPAAWFTLTRGRTGVENAVIIALTALLVLFVVRQFLAGCRHWVYVHPKDLVRTRSALDDPARSWGWWFDLLATARRGSPHETAGQASQREANAGRHQAD
jgi:hypothetical protein